MGDDDDGENDNLLHGCYVTEAGYGVQGRLGGEIGGVIDVGEDGIQQSTTWWRRDATTGDETARRQMYMKFQGMGNHQNEDQRRPFFSPQKQH